MSDTHRILRVIEYVGTPEFIRDAIEKRGVKGERIVNGAGNRHGRIREAFIGETAEVLANTQLATTISVERETIAALAEISTDLYGPAK